MDGNDWLVDAKDRKINTLLDRNKGLQAERDRYKAALERVCREPMEVSKSIASEALYGDTKRSKRKGVGDGGGSPPPDPLHSTKDGCMVELLEGGLCGEKVPCDRHIRPKH